MRAVHAIPLLLLLGTGACSGPVPRVAKGRTQVGRYVDTRAYGAYSRGAYLEAIGDVPGAIDQYRAALQYDSSSPELWSRLGALTCQSDRDLATTNFRAAAAVNRGYAPLWYEVAKCELNHDHLTAASRAARQAVRLDPDPASYTVLVAKILTKQGRKCSAGRWLRALTLRQPLSALAWRSLYEFAQQQDDADWRDEAYRHLSLLNPSFSVPPGAQPRALNALLLIDDLAGARKLATQKQLSPGKLALYALDLGKTALAREQAQWVLLAKPMDLDARIALLIVQDLTMDPIAFRQALNSFPKSSGELSPLARQLMSELLERRHSSAAANTWLEAAPTSVEAAP